MDISLLGKGSGYTYQTYGSESAPPAPNIHTPLVMVLALVPGLGSVVYLASRPLRHKLLVRLLLDQIAWKLPFGLYTRMHLDRILPPPSTKGRLAHQVASQSYRVIQSQLSTNGRELSTKSFSYPPATSMA